MRAEGGRWTLDDLAGYEVKERKPLSAEYHGYHMVTAPPPWNSAMVIGRAPANQVASEGPLPGNQRNLPSHSLGTRRDRQDPRC